MRYILALIAMACSLAWGQVYEGSAGGWVVTKTQQFFRNYGVVDAQGNYAYQVYTLVGSSYVKGPDFRAARIIVDTGVPYVQFGDGHCVTMDAAGVQTPQTCPGVAAPPPVVVPPPPPPVTAVTTTIYVVPLRYQMYDGAGQASIDAYNKTLPKVTQAALQPIMDRVNAWYLKTTYGTRNVKIVVLPDVNLGKANSCDFGKIWTDASTAANFKSYDVLIGVTPYTCWSSQGTTSGNFIAVWGTTQDGAGLYAHEIGHALGMGHAASMFNGVYQVYGSGYDQMGRGSDFYNMVGLGANHLNTLGALKWLPCASTTLRSITDYPDAIQCGDYSAYYLGDWHDQVWISKREWIYSSRGGSDVTEYAHLSPGQSYTAGGHTYTYKGKGVVSIL